MRSFEGFLVDYCADLTGARTTSVKKLGLLCRENPRAEEPVALYAAACGRLDFLIRCESDTSLGRKAVELAQGVSASGGSLQSYLDSLEDTSRLKKPFLSWLSDCGKVERDRLVVSRVAVKLLEAMKAAGITRAQAARLTGINKGNFYAWLSGAEGKVSRAAAVEAYNTVAALLPMR